MKQITQFFSEGESPTLIDNWSVLQKPLIQTLL